MKIFSLPPRMFKGPEHNRYQRNLWGVGERQFQSIPSVCQNPNQERRIPTKKEPIE